MATKKVLLMGRAESGKTSMRSIIFANYLARETSRLGPTFDVDRSHVRFLDGLVLNLWDCGGQTGYLEKYLDSQKDSIFSNVEVLIFVFDISRLEEPDLKMYSRCLEALEQFSKSAKIFCFIHKMDLVEQNKREQTFKNCHVELQTRSRSFDITCFQTSIWDESLYKAWSSLVCSLIPNKKVLEDNLSNFCDICEADEVVLFEKATFLVISHSTRKKQRDVHRFEKISNIIKQFKLSCGKVGAQYQSMETRNGLFSAFIESFTSNTYIMVVVSDPSIQAATILLNIGIARKQFETIVQMSSTAEK
eukprot:c18534_g2_i1.p1 GENE.c18534_g2_i1~~c18534_g2_i1.p1  ORF type:complete len:305 (-),score=75.71 c18534_g2_i1:67-981(-)